MAALDFLFDPWMMQQPGQQPPFGGLPGFPPPLPTAPMFPPTPPRMPIGQGDASLNSETDPANSIHRALASLRPEVPSFPPSPLPPQAMPDATAPAMPGSLPPNAPDWATGGLLKPMTMPSGPTLGDKLSGVSPDTWGSILKMLLPGGAGVAAGARAGADAGKPQWPAPPPVTPPMTGAPVPNLGVSTPEAVPSVDTPAPEPAAAPSAPAPSASPGAQPPSWLQSAAQPRFQEEMPHPGFGGAPKVETIGPENAPRMTGAPSAGGGVLDWLGQNRNMLAMMGAGIAGGKNTGDAVAGALQGSVQGRTLDRQESGRNSTERALIGKGLDPDIARAAVENPELMRVILPIAFKPQVKFMTPEQKQSLNLPANLPWYTGPDGVPALPGGMAPKFEKLAQGETGQFVSPIGASGATFSGGPEKPPQGFDWVNPKDTSQGLKAIPGGPGTHIPDTAAGKVGIMRPFMEDYPKIREGLAKGGVSGPIDWSMAKLGYGEQGETYRKIQSGTDALRRILTGAGMPAQEAQEYTDRYLPRWRDTTEVALSKVDQLNRELMSMNELLLQGRTSDPNSIKGSIPGIGGGYRVLGVR